MSMSSFFDGLATVFEPVTKFMTDHPIVSTMLVNGIAGIFEPSKYDKERDRLQAQKEFADVERKRRNKNLEVGGLQLPEPASRAQNYMNSPLQRRRQPPPQVDPLDPLAPYRQQGMLQ